MPHYTILAKVVNVFCREHLILLPYIPTHQDAKSWCSRVVRAEMEQTSV